MKKYYIVEVKSVRKIMSYDEASDTEIYTYISDVVYVECSKEKAMQRLDRDRKLINMIDKLRAA